MSNVVKTTCFLSVSHKLNSNELREYASTLNQRFSKAGGPTEGILQLGKDDALCKLVFNFGSTAIAAVNIKKSKKKKHLDVEIHGHLDLMRSYCRKVYKGDMEVLVQRWLTASFTKDKSEQHQAQQEMAANWA